MKFFSYLILVLFLSSCIGDDLVFDEVGASIRITNPLDTLAVGDMHTFESMYLNIVGAEEAADVIWSSMDSTIISITSDGVATGLATGASVIGAETTVDGEVIRDELLVNVGASTVSTSTEKSGTLRTTSSYGLKGDFVLAEESGGLVLSFAENYETTDVLPGLYLYLTNNPSTTAGALSLGEVTIFEGAHSYEIPSGVGLNDYQYVLFFCKPFNVKVGDGELK